MSKEEWLLLSEYEEQKLLVQWFDIQYGKKYILFAIPNGIFTKNIIIAQKAKATGLRKGIPDLFLAQPNITHCGLFIEMKREKGGKLTKDQKDMMFELTRCGYCCVVAKGFEEAKKAIEEYLHDIHR